MSHIVPTRRLLTLPNGERIRLQPHCCMICETFDLQYASPATISRCGMVWADPKNLGSVLSVFDGAFTPSTRHDVVAGFFVEFEAIRAGTGPSSSDG